MINVGTVFSGIGAIEHALDILELSHNIEFACDNGERKLKSKTEEIASITEKMTNIEKNDYIAQLYNQECGINNVEQTYRANYQINNDMFYQDVRFLDGRQYEGNIDLFVGGSPCQSFSVAGKRGGLEEARGTLFYDYARLVSEIKPKVFIYENVPGMLNHDGGKTWTIISEIFNELEYHWDYWLLNSKDYGLPQNRRRIFVIGFRKDLTVFYNKLTKPAPFPLNIGMKALLDDNIDNKYYLPQKGFLRVIDPKHKKHVALNGRIARCQVANQQFNWYGDMRFETVISDCLLNDERIYKGYYNGKLGVARCLTPRECLRLMGFSDSFKIPENVSNQNMYRQIGNSIAVNVLIEIVKRVYETGIFSNDSK
ncbi:MAG: DNA cytosine methyltransferase [Eubacteriaceae bacterium]